jgi:hypothetical protein
MEGKNLAKNGLSTLRSVDKPEDKKPRESPTAKVSGFSHGRNHTVVGATNLSQAQKLRGDLFRWLKGRDAELPQGKAQFVGHSDLPLCLGGPCALVAGIVVNPN